MVQEFGEINLLKIKKEIKELEEKLKLVDNNEKTIILDKLLSYYKLLSHMSVNTEDFFEKYYNYNEQIQKLIDTATKNYIGILKYIKNNRQLLRKLSENINIFLDSETLIEDPSTLTPISKDNFLDIISYIYDKNFVDFIYNEIKNNRIHFNTSITYDENYFGGTCINVEDKNYYVIEKLNKGYYYINLFAFIHELSHGYINSKYNNDFTCNPFREVFSYYNELKLNKYLVDNKLCYNDSLLQDTFFLKDIFTHSNSLYIWTYLVDAVKKDGNIDDEKYGTILSENDYFITKIFACNVSDDDYFETLIYFLGYVISLEQYYKYLNDPEKTEYNFDKVYRSNINTPFIAQLSNLDINKIELESGKQVDNYLKDYCKRYSKSKY